MKDKGRPLPFVASKVPMDHVQDTSGIEGATREWKFGADDICRGQPDWPHHSIVIPRFHVVACHLQLFKK